MISPETLPTFADLLSPVDPDQFLATAWQREPFVIARRARDHYAGLFDRHAFSRLLMYGEMSRRDARAIRSGAVDPEQVIFDARGVADPLAMMNAYAEGYSLVLNNLQERDRRVAELCRGLEVTFRHPVGANAYLTPCGAQGLAAHYDDHDVFVLQIDGSKVWRLHPPVVELPLRGEYVDVDEASLGPPQETVELDSGDLMYLPRGTIHQAVATTASSLHLTLGMSSNRWADVLARAATRFAAVEPTWRRALDLSPADAHAPTDAVDMHWPPIERLRGLVPEVLTQLEIEFIETLRPLEDGGFDHLDACRDLTLMSQVRHRLGTICRADSDERSARIRFPGGTVVCPPAAAGALEFIAQHEEFAVGDLPDLLEDSAKLNVVRKLVVAGMLIPC